MHDNRAVGKMLSYVPDDARQQIEMTAYVSKGAEDTWQKVLDGTLRGFSIGLYNVKYKAGTNPRVITSYDLGEVSLVDCPANPQAMISLIKAEKRNLIDRYLRRLRLLELTGV